MVIRGERADPESQPSCYKIIVTISAAAVDPYAQEHQMGTEKGGVSPVLRSEAINRKIYFNTPNLNPK